MSICPRCKNDATGQNRLVTDSCGHNKCRRCLLEDVSECLECKLALPPNHEEGKQTLPTTTTTISATSNNHITTTEQGYHCTVCNKSFRSRTQQYYHRSCGNELLRKYHCAQCNRRFATHSHLKYHLNSHGLQSSYACSHCGKCFKQKTIMQRHMRMHKRDLHRCQICQKDFCSQDALKTHAVMHSGQDLPYKCDICDRRYLTKANLKQHLLKHDQNSPRHSCGVCQKSFLRLSTLVLHQKRHNKRERYACDHCQKMYTDADTLVRHMKQHTARDRYRCIQCDITVNRRDNMYRHMRAMHPGVLFESGVEIISASVAAKDDKIAAVELPAEQAVRYSSVIKSVGNVEPVVLPLPELQLQQPIAPVSLPNEMQKENVKLYRKIILDLDNEEYSNETMSAELSNSHIGEEEPTMRPQEQQQQHRTTGHASSNFSEMHWRKNFKYSYENEHTN